MVKQSIPLLVVARLLLLFLVLYEFSLSLVVELEELLNLVRLLVVEEAEEHKINLVYLYRLDQMLLP
jgi:hypothetical protein